MFEKITNELKEAMKSGDKFKLSVLRMLKSALQLEQINAKHDLTDEECISVIKKQVKMRKDSVTEFQKYNKTDEVEKLTQEINILSEYLPEEATEEQINSALDEIFEEMKPTSMKEMGLIMKEMGTRLPNADMSLVSKLVKSRLS